MKMGKLTILLTSILIFLSIPDFAFAETVTNQDSNSLLELKIGDGGELTSSVKVFIMVGLLSLAPSLFLMLTCFTQVIIVLSIARQGLGTMTAPPNQVMVGLALFITLFIMNPVISDINENAWKPYNEGKIQYQEALVNAEKPLKKYMVNNTYEEHISLFLKKQDIEVKKQEDVPMQVLIPANILSQIQKGLLMGMMIYVGLSVIDMIVAAILMFMGMFMLPPQMLSLPLKILIFIFIGGFSLIVEMLFHSIKV
jgi:flagellar biosynthesis protein FliP